MPTFFVVAVLSFMVDSLSNYHSFAVWLEWSAMDILVSAWMLNPDMASPRTYAELLNEFDLKAPAKKVFM